MPKRKDSLGSAEGARSTDPREHDPASRQFAEIGSWLSESPPSREFAPCNDDEWRAFTQSVNRRGLAGLVLARADSGAREIPSWVRASLRDSASRVAADNLHIMHELERVLHPFNGACLPVMLLKGAALNLTVYPTPALRPMSDVDLLVRPGDAQRALRLLEGIGCRRGLDLIRDDFFPRYYYEVEVIVPSVRPVRIDLHARPLRPLRLARIIPDDALWGGAREVRVGSAAAVVPRAEYNFIHLAAHAAYHGCSRLIWLYDIKRLVEEVGETMDWDLVVARCGEWRLSLAVHEALVRAAVTFGPFCPSAVIQRLARDHATWRDRLTLHHAPRDSTSPIGHVVCNLLCTPGLRFRLGYLGALLFPSRAHLASLYRLRHPGWALCAHAWRLARAIGRLLAAPLGVLTPTGAR